MPFNVATIKDKAVSAKNVTVSKIQDTRDKHSSMPMARTRFADDGYLPKAPPPPPPGRRSFNSSHGGGEEEGLENETGTDAYGYRPPPVLRSTKPGLRTSPSPPPPPPSRGHSVLQRAKAFQNTSPPPSSSAPTPPVPRAPAQRWSAQPTVAHQQQPTSTSINSQVDIDKIDWTNLSYEDKQAFFGWLDEFFAHYIEKLQGVRLDDTSKGGNVGTGEKYGKPPPAPFSPALEANTAPNRGPPPPVRSWSKPPASPSPTPSQSYSQPQTMPEFQSSYPPPTTYGSQANDLAYYFHPSNEWDTPWYASQGAVPPPLQTNPHRLYKAQMMSRGDARSITFAVLFCDLSAAWVSVSFSHSTRQITERGARYLGVPDSMGGEELREASELYGEMIASYAEGFLSSGQFCARGECWDLASEALKYVTSSSAVPAPIPSLGRTHGHLIFVGRATKERGGLRQEGRWRGGDDRVRRGDIVEWRTVRIARVGDPPGGYAILGDPEHTAVITRDSIPSPQQSSGGVYDGARIEPRALLSLEVVEQSLNDPPEPVKRTYDLSRFEEGEVWIYRPVGMERYLGFEELVCEAPPHAASI